MTKILMSDNPITKWKQYRQATLMTMVAIVLASMSTMVLAQRNATTTIFRTDHDFTRYTWWDDTSGALGTVDHAGAGENLCAVCHGPPAFTGTMNGVKFGKDGNVSSFTGARQ